MGKSEPNGKAWGGTRRGAGRKPKPKPGAGVVSGIDYIAAMAAPPPDEIDAVAQVDGKGSIAALAKILMFAASEAARVSAASEMLDRGYGKPAVEIGGDAMLPLPFMAAPSVVTQTTASAELRAEARKYANVALEVLRNIRDHGASETARTSATKALLNRGYGTVGAARLPEEMRERPMGKKEQAAQAAKMAGTGRFATPTPPRPLTDVV